MKDKFTERWLLQQPLILLDYFLKNKDVKRVFIAISIGQQIKSILPLLKSAVHCNPKHIKWISLQNIHLNLSFIGDVLINDIPVIVQAVEKWGSQLFVIPFGTKNKDLSDIEGSGWVEQVLLQFIHEDDINCRRQRILQDLDRLFTGGRLDNFPTELYHEELLLRHPDNL